MGIGSDGVTETGAVPNGLTGTGVINADVQVWLGVHLQKEHHMASAQATGENPGLW